MQYEDMSFNFKTKSIACHLPDIEVAGSMFQLNIVIGIVTSNEKYLIFITFRSHATIKIK